MMKWKFRVLRKENHKIFTRLLLPIKCSAKPSLVITHKAFWSLPESKLLHFSKGSGPLAWPVFLSDLRQMAEEDWPCVARCHPVTTLLRNLE